VIFERSKRFVIGGDRMREDKKQYQQIENYIKNPHFRKKQQQAIFFILNQIELINQELTGKYKRDIIDSVVSRTKSAESVKKKLIRKGLPVDIKHVEERLHDLTGVRISCTFLDDVYRIAEKMEKNPLFKVVKVKDYIKEPKSSGYRSIHMIVLVPVDEDEDVGVELQIRTTGMNYWAKLDHQLSYKAEENEEMDKIRRDLKFYAEEISRIDRKLLKIRTKIEKMKDKKISDK
jgi:putative GTP pyrophosphokinase